MTTGQQFRIDVEEWLAGGAAPREVRDTTAEIVISVNSRLITEVEDREAKTIRKSVRASAYPLALWLVSNWWRLRWEPYKESGPNGSGLDWGLSHSLPATGGGYVWPPLMLASDGQNILLRCDAEETSEDASLTPIRYLNSFDTAIKPDAFETAISSFVEHVLARLDSLGCRQTLLHELWSTVYKERKDRAQGSRRKLEALLGLDPDDNSDLINKLLNWQTTVGEQALEEIAAASESRQIQAELDKAKTIASTVRTFVDIPGFETIKTDIRQQAVAVDTVPWKFGQRIAYRVRDAWEMGTGPVHTKDIADRLQVSEENLERYHVEAPFAFGIKGRQEDKLKIILNRAHEHSRRFDLMRLIGDFLVVETNDHWRPATRSLTARQKFQRAFAAEFLCPSLDLAKRYPGPYNVDQLDEITTKISQDYNVSARLALNHLANRGSIPHLRTTTEDWRGGWSAIPY